MSYLNVKNRAETTLASGITDSDLSLTVATGEGAKLPDDNFMITIEDEILFCSGRSTDVLTVVREQEGTTASAHAGGVAVELRVTAGVIQGLERGCGQTNFETLSGAKTLTPGTDAMYQYLAEGGSSKVITLETTGAKAGDRFVIRHNGVFSVTYYLEIKQGLTLLDKLWPGAIKQFLFDGTNWICGEAGTGEVDEKFLNFCIGKNAIAYNQGLAIGYATEAYEHGVAIGHSAKGYTYGVGVGKYASGRTYGVGVGYYARGQNYGVALGYHAEAGGKMYAVAIGHYSKCERYSEIAHNINGGDTDQENNITIGGWDGWTSDNTPKEIFCGGTDAQRFTIRAKSVLAFTMLITGRDNTSGDCAAYKVEGAIKRDASDNTAMLASAVVAVIHEDDATWDVAVTADDTNEALIITVTGDADNSVQWAARLDGVETHF